jgi:hypothetical protein
MLYKCIAASMLVAAMPAGAQTIVSPAPATISSQPATATVIPQLAPENILRKGVPVPVVLSQALTTKGKHLKVGQTVRLEVASDVMLNGRVVIPAGSPVEGVLTHVRNKGMWGKSGAIRLHINSVTVNGVTIRLSGDMDTRGETGTVGVVGAVAFVPVAGFFVTGTSAEMPLNMPGRAFLEEDIALAVPGS